MIKQKEIVEIAARKQVPKMSIDKDWVLGHFLNAMFSFADMRNNFGKSATMSIPDLI